MQNSGSAIAQKRRPVETFLTGALSGTFTGAMLQPFDVVKTTQQGWRHRPATAGAGEAASRAIGPLAAARVVVAEEGASALWKGLGATVTRVFFGAGVYFVILNQLVTWDAAQNADSTLSPASRSFLIGGAARGIAATLMNPVSVVKTRLELARKNQLPYRNTIHAVYTIARSEGPRGLYAGLLTTIMRDAPFSGIYLSGYARFRPWIAAEGSRIPGLPDSVQGFAKTLVAGTAAGAVATLTTHPFDVLKTRLQIRIAARAGLFSAPSPADLEVTRDGIVASRDALSSSSSSSSSTPTTTTMASTTSPTAGSGPASTYSTTKHPPGPRPLWSRSLLAREVVKMVEEDGPRSFFRGVLARMGKRSVQSALTWAFFEQIAPLWSRNATSVGQSAPSSASSSPRRG